MTMNPSGDMKNKKWNKAITIISKGIGRPSPEEMKHLEENDQTPHFLLYENTIGSDILDERYLKNAPVLRRFLYTFIPTTLAQVFEAFLVRKHYDVVITWSAQNVLPYALLLKLTRTHYPHIALMSWLSKPKKKVFLRFVHSHIDRLIVWSSVQSAIALRETGIPRSKVVLVSRRADTAFWRPQHAIPDTICSVGQEMRDYATLFKALAGTEIPCHIATGAFYGKRNKVMQEGDVLKKQAVNITISKLNNSELRSLYARSRFVVVPLLQSDTDNGVTTIEESMAMGKAVICSRTKGQVDIIQEGSTGLFVPVGDPVALQKAILYLWENPGIAEAMGRKGREFIEKNHTLNKFVHDVNNTVDEVIQEQHIGGLRGKRGTFVHNAAASADDGNEKMQHKQSIATDT